TGRVVEKRSHTARSVFVASGIIKKRINPAGGVRRTRVPVESLRPVGGVIEARPIEAQRRETGPGVVAATCIRVERIVSQSDVIVPCGVRLQGTCAQRFIEGLRTPRARSECQQRSQAQQQDRKDGFHDFIYYWRLV